MRLRRKTLKNPSTAASWLCRWFPSLPGCRKRRR